MNHPSETRVRALTMIKAGKRKVDIARELKVPEQTVSTWAYRDAEAKAKAKAKKPKAKKPKPTSATSYLAKQLEIVAKMIRAKLPELARFALTTTDDGKASIEYAVRQTTMVSGTVKL